LAGLVFLVILEVASWEKHFLEIHRDGGNILATLRNTLIPMFGWSVSRTGPHQHISIHREIIALQGLLLSLLLPFLIAAQAAPLRAISTPPAVGDKAPDFTLSTQQGKRVRLSEKVAKAPVVLVVLRGYPGYQCPLCNQQVNDFLKNSQGFMDAKVQVILVYPGPPENLGARATEFVADRKLPENFELLLDPGYEFTNLYGLRWDAPSETAYPATFLIDQKGIVFFSKISKSHGGRTKAVEILDALTKKKTA